MEAASLWKTYAKPFNQGLPATASRLRLHLRQPIPLDPCCEDAAQKTRKAVAHLSWRRRTVRLLAITSK